MTDQHRQRAARARARGRRYPRSKRSRSESALAAMLSAAALMLLLWLVAGLMAPGLGVINQPLWQLQDSAVLWRTLASVLAIVASGGLAFATLGLLLSRGQLVSGVSAPRAVLVSAASAAAVTLICALLKDRWLPSVWPLYLLLTLPCALSGALLAIPLRRLRRPLLGTALVGSALTFTALAALSGLALVVLEPAPLPITGISPSAAERVRLARHVRAGSPRDMAPGTTKTLALTANDINLLAAWGLSLGSDKRHLYVSLSADDMHVAATIGWAPRWLQEPLYLNVSGTAQPHIMDGALSPGIRRAQVGSLAIPPLVANLLARGLYDFAAADPRFDGALGALRQVQVRSDLLTATYGPMDLPEGLRADLFGALGDADLVAVAFSEHLHLQRRIAAAFAAGQVPADQHLATLVADSFALAAGRHAQFGTDPVLESRLAVISLGLSLGHRRIAEVVPQLPVAFEQLPAQWATAQLQGRSDWTRHFWLSAALTMLSDQAVSIDLGYLKEELDADGGSGFSFADLGADLAGVALAEALRRPGNAAVLLARLSDPGNIAALAPQLGDLPENISAKTLQTQYGGTKGAEYQRLLSEIRRRVRSTALYAGGR